MSPQCTQKEFDFDKHFRCRITARFDGGPISSDGGAILLREADRRLRSIPRQAGCFEDHRDPLRIEHSVSELLAQRLYAIALGYEDLNDHDELRRDPLLGLRGIQWVRAQTEAMRRRLLKIGMQVRVSARRVWLALADSWPYPEQFERIWRALRAPPLLRTRTV